MVIDEINPALAPDVGCVVTRHAVYVWAYVVTTIQGLAMVIEGSNDTIALYEGRDQILCGRSVLRWLLSNGLAVGQRFMLRLATPNREPFFESRVVRIDPWTAKASQRRWERIMTRETALEARRKRLARVRSTRVAALDKFAQRYPDYVAPHIPQDFLSINTRTTETHWFRRTWAKSLILLERAHPLWIMAFLVDVADMMRTTAELHVNPYLVIVGGRTGLPLQLDYEVRGCDRHGP